MPNTPVVDPYAVFVAEQKKREATWSANRAAKRTKTTEANTPSAECSIAVVSPRLTDNNMATQTPRSTQNDVAVQTTPVTPKPSANDEVSCLKLQLEERSRACDILTAKVEELQEANHLAAEKHLLVSEKFFKVSANHHVTDN